METKRGQHEIPFEKYFKILGYIFNPTAKSYESVEDSMQKKNTRQGAETPEFTGAKNGESNAHAWWIRSTTYSSLGAKADHGISRL